MKHLGDGFEKLFFAHQAEPGLISVIIPVYKDSSGLRKTLASLKSQERLNQYYEVIVAIDGPDQDLLAICKSFKIKAVVINPNCGSYYARNRAVERSKGEYLAFTDADVCARPDWLDQGFNYLQEADYVAGQVMIDRAAVNGSAHYFELKTAFPVKKHLEEEHFGPTANLFVRRRVLEQVGGFDSRFRYGGDNEFGDRVYRADIFKQIYGSGAVVLHPPRSFWAVVEKRRRGMQAMRDRYLFYPQRYPGYSTARVFFKTFLPCTRETIAPVVAKQTTGRFLFFFFFCWLIKVFSGISFFIKGLTIVGTDTIILPFLLILSNSERKKSGSFSSEICSTTSIATTISNLPSN